MTQPTDGRDPAADGPEVPASFFERPGVKVETISVGPGVRLGIERVTNSAIGIGGAYGTWGEPCGNAELPEAVEHILGHPLESSPLNVGDFGFFFRHHVPELTPEEHLEVELAAGARFLTEAISATGWQPDEVDAVLIGVTMPVSEDFVERIASRAGIPEGALKVSIHKACDGSVAGMNLALNPQLAVNHLLNRNLARELLGKKVLVGGIEGLSRVMKTTYDRQALQLFGNGAGIFGMIPGRTLKFLVGGSQEVYDEEGVLQVRMTYPHSPGEPMERRSSKPCRPANISFRVAGLMHEPSTDAGPVVMAGPMGMVKLFVRSGVIAVRGVYGSYRDLMAQLAMPSKEIAVGDCASRQLQDQSAQGEAVAERGDCHPDAVAAERLRQRQRCLGDDCLHAEAHALAPGDHVLFDGFGAGTYYDVLAVEMGHK